MSESGGGMTVLDGTHLRSLQISLPESTVIITGAQLLEFADSKVSESLFNLPLPQSIKSAAFQRLDVSNDISSWQTELTREAATTKLDHYITAVADELKDNPMVISVLDGNTLRVFLEDEDDFAMLAENLFTELDTEDKGKISKSELRNALVHMGVEMGVPPIQDFPLLNDILEKHGAGEGDLGQSQFAELLQPILQEIADALAKDHVVFVHNIKIVDGSKLRKLLIDDKQLNKVTEKIFQEKQSTKDGQSTEIIRGFLEKNGKKLGFPQSEANEAVILLYDAVFADIESGKCAAESDDEFRELVKEILEKIADQLDANPIYCDLDN
ncbi:uncharacterized protein LOC126675420 [Mercurialis annua]|uniref:uncharacterized protein LOC126675420 n=1 Tax=Mercurialis annua TaxID=3986 RepID=UPI00215F1AB2|nr:uncharacterized protein LOC126675420 [Mercurialis annua]